MPLRFIGYEGWGAAEVPGGDPERGWKRFPNEWITAIADKKYVSDHPETYSYSDLKKTYLLS